MASQVLENRLHFYRLRILRQGIPPNRRMKMVVGVEHGRIKELNHSGPAPNPMVQKLRNKLLQIGPIGSKGFDNHIGCCAEPRAANELLMQDNRPALSALVFTEARVTRTGRKERQCRNCRFTF